MCVPQLLSGVHELDCLREETVPVPGCSGAQSSSVDKTVNNIICYYCIINKSLSVPLWSCLSCAARAV